MIHHINIKMIKLVKVKTVGTIRLNLLLARAENSLRTKLYVQQNFVLRKTITNFVTHFVKNASGTKTRKWLGS